MTNARYQLSFFLLFLGGALCFGCGKKIERTTSAAQAEEMPGVFWSSLNPVNPRVNNQVTGSVKISRFGDSFSMNVVLKDAPGSRHIQALHLGERCPDLSLDRNRDGYVDSNESFGVTGLMIVPMDQDISFQGRTHEFPFGNYSYQESTSYSRMLSDLHEYDEVFNDAVAKLKGGVLPLSGKVVIIYGADTNHQLPPTISRLDGNTPHHSLPIACGKLALIAESPEEDNPPPQVELPNPEPLPRPVPIPDDTPSTRRTYDPGSEDPDARPSTRRPRRSWWCRLRLCEQA